MKLIFLTVSGAVSLRRLSRREEWWKDAEILMLRHQLGTQVSVIVTATRSSSFINGAHIPVAGAQRKAIMDS